MAAVAKPSAMRPMLAMRDGMDAVNSATVAPSPPRPDFMPARDFPMSTFASAWRDWRALPAPAPR
ncbi:hypothetical protein COSO111634_34115 [Corallococcus soli]